ncbi:MAG: diacylglycerol kinase family protein [Verrucomicrobiia bacterium]
MHRVFAIFNPAARGEKSQRLRQFLESKASSDSGITLAGTRGPGDARPLAMQAVADGYELIVAAGGDGTINEVVNGIGRSGVALGVLPLGTANVFARALGVPLELNAAWTVIERRRTLAIDLPVAKFGGAERYFIELAGVGFDAVVVRTASWELKKKIGPLSYVWAGMKAASRKHADVEVVLDNVRQLADARGAAVLIGNGRFYGGPFELFPEAKLDDGRLDVCVFESVGYFDMLRYGRAALSGKHVDLHDVQYFQAENFICRTASPDSGAGAATVPFELDGEDVGQTPVQFSVLPRALRVIVP